VNYLSRLIRCPFLFALYKAVVTAPTQVIWHWVVCGI